MGTKKEGIEELNSEQRQQLINGVKSALISRHNNSEEIKTIVTNKISGYPGHKFYSTLIDDIKLLLELDNPFSKSWLIKLLHSPENNFETEKLNYLRDYIIKANEIREVQASIPFQDYKDVSNKTKRAIGQYKISLVKKYNTVRLGIIDFEMPIEYIIPKELKHYSKELKTEEKKLLELEQSYIDNPEKITQVRNALKKIREKLREEIPISYLLRRRKHVFIHSPAGSGKTTFLKWITYSLCKNTTFKLTFPVFPIYIELRSYVGSIQNMIDKKITDHIEMDEILASKVQTVLCIDGYDEFTGDDKVLLVQIQDFASKDNVTVIMSGRTKPNYEKFMKMESFHLNILNKNDIKQILRNVFKEKGEIYFNQLIEIGIEQLQNPLHLTLLMGYIKAKNKLDTILISKILKNKGEFYKTILIDQYLKNYEPKRKDNSNVSSTRKHVEIHLVSYLAYFMTFVKNNLEDIAYPDLHDALTDYITENKLSYEKVSTSELISTFVDHDILTTSDELVGFEKKEIRLFFAALHLAETIQSQKEWIALKRKQLDHSYTNPKYLFGLGKAIRYGENETWDSVKDYFFGLVNAKKMIDTNIEIKYHDRFVFTFDFFEQLEIYIGLLEQNNSPSIGSFNSTLKVFNFLSNVVLNNNRIEKEKKTSRGLLDSIFIYDLIRKNIVRDKIPENWLSEEFIDRMNNSLITRSYYNEGHYIKYICLLLLGNNLNLRFKQIMPLISKMSNSYAKSIFTYRLFHPDGDKTKVQFDVSDIVQLLYVDMINGDHPFKLKKGEYTNYQFVSDNFKKFNSQLLDYFFHLHPQPTLMQICRMINYYHNKLNGRSELVDVSDNSGAVMIEYFITGILLINREKHLIKLSDFIKYLDPKFRDKVLDEFIEIIQNTSINITSRKRYLDFLIWNLREKDFSLFMDLIDDKYDKVADRAIGALTYLITPFRGRKPHLTPIVFEKLDSVLKSSQRSEDIKKGVIFYLRHWLLDIPEYLLDTVFNLIKNSGTTYYSHGLNFLGDFKVKKAVRFLESLLHSSDYYSYSSDAYFALFNIDYQNHYKYFDLIKDSYEDNIGRLEYFSSSEEFIEDVFLFIDALHLGDEKTHSLYKEIKLKNVSKSIRYIYKDHLTRLDWKITRLEEAREESKVKKPS
ncbi:NACHT domain-containing NTPase [uncultured Psychroserpens sp.]|uniref:NACHT domain-containing protein n=1 Tax=uncultured Psychroserpens sp. TaxID=255436 RepID=UPI00261014EA|nr:NACHT domain-containing protein [uncultured Psychroserpens sp.]